MIGSLECLLRENDEEDVAALLEFIRTLLAEKGPLAVEYDPRRIRSSAAVAVRSAVVSADSHATLASLDSPIRRLVLRRMAEGPCSFSQAMRAARMTDTARIAFHLRKLTRSGLVLHVPGSSYSISPRGLGAITILDGIDHLSSGSGSRNEVFAWHSNGEPHL